MEANNKFTKQTNSLETEKKIVDDYNTRKLKTEIIKKEYNEYKERDKFLSQKQIQQLIKYNSYNPHIQN